jgi:PLP dependent protein
MMTNIARNLDAIRGRIGSACSRSGRDPSTVTLIAVTKTVPAEVVREGVEAGLTVFGENYIQEARTKMEALSDLTLSWHFIGHLQSNKARVALESFDWVHTVDRSSLARELDRHAHKMERRVPVLLQVNVGDEESKHGAPVEELRALFDLACSLEGLAVRGLMALPPYEDDAELVRPHFRRMRQLLDELRASAARPEELTELSMGMSHDFDVAIEEGATMIRVGTDLFGSRLA